MAKQFGSTTPDDNAPKEKSAYERARDAEADARKSAAARRANGDNVADLVRQQIALPPNFHRIDGHHLFGDNYRVNVIVAEPTEEDYGKSLRIERSYFVVSNGIEIMRSEPALPSYPGALK